MSENAPHWSNKLLVLKFWVKGPSKKNVSIALQQIAVMLLAGVPIRDVFKAMQNQVDDLPLGLVLADLDKKVIHMGWKLSRAMLDHPDVFPPYCSMFARAGEESGDLYQRLRRMGSLMERECNMAQQIKAALAGPLITLVVACSVLLLSVKFVMPRFVTMYEDMKVPLPAITVWVIGIINTVNHPLFLFGVLGLLGFVRWKRKLLRQWMFNGLVRIPKIGRWIGIVLCAQFCDILGSLVREGVPIIKALHMIARTSGYQTHRNYLMDVHKQLVAEGDFAESLRCVPYFPTMLRSVATVGQEAGSLEKLLASLNRILEQEVDHTIFQVMSLLEPIMICVLGFITAFFFVGMFLPVYGMLQRLGG